MQDVGPPGAELDFFVQLSFSFSTRPDKFGVSLVWLISHLVFRSEMLPPSSKTSEPDQLGSPANHCKFVLNSFSQEGLGNQEQESD